MGEIMEEITKEQKLKVRREFLNNLDWAFQVKEKQLHDLIHDAFFRGYALAVGNRLVASDLEKFHKELNKILEGVEKEKEDE